MSYTLKNYIRLFILSLLVSHSIKSMEKILINTINDMDKTVEITISDVTHKHELVYSVRTNETIIKTFPKNITHCTKAIHCYTLQLKDQQILLTYPHQQINQTKCLNLVCDSGENYFDNIQLNHNATPNKWVKVGDKLMPVKGCYKIQLTIPISCNQ